jgi:hypothetical protein
LESTKCEMTLNAKGILASRVLHEKKHVGRPRYRVCPCLRRIERLPTACCLVWPPSTSPKPSSARWVARCKWAKSPYRQLAAFHEQNPKTCATWLVAGTPRPPPEASNGLHDASQDMDVDDVDAGKAKDVVQHVKIQLVNEDALEGAKLVGLPSPANGLPVLCRLQSFLRAHFCTSHLQLGAQIP